MMVGSFLFYDGTIGVLSRDMDAALRAVSTRLSNTFQSLGGAAGQVELQILLNDDQEVDTEVYALLGPNFDVIMGNLSEWRGTMTLDRLMDRELMRTGRPALCRLLAHRLPDGTILVVGRKMEDRQEIERLVVRSLLAGGGLVVLLAFIGAAMVRNMFNRQIAAVRKTAAGVDAGNFSLRIPVTEDAHDEFSQLSRDINHMLERIQHLMDGVRQVSNAIAHDLRTPLGSLRGKLDMALRSGRDRDDMVEAVQEAMDGIDGLIALFEKLLLIAEVESGANRHAFQPVALSAIITDMAEMFDAMAEEKDVHLEVDLEGLPEAVGDRDLLATAVANLISNALKYTGPGGRVRLSCVEKPGQVAIVVEDNGPGIPAHERGNVVKRFYRLDVARSQPGSGLGLSLVTAVANMHHGALVLEDANPGLRACIVLPCRG